MVVARGILYYDSDSHFYTQIIVYVNPLLSPVIYVMYSKRYKESFKDMLASWFSSCCCFSCNKRERLRSISGKCVDRSPSEVNQLLCHFFLLLLTFSVNQKEWLQQISPMQQICVNSWHVRKSLQSQLRCTNLSACAQGRHPNPSASLKNVTIMFHYIPTNPPFNLEWARIRWERLKFLSSFPWIPHPPYKVINFHLISFRKGVLGQLVTVFRKLNDYSLARPTVATSRKFHKSFWQVFDKFDGSHDKKPAKNRKRYPRWIVH